MTNEIKTEAEKVLADVKAETAKLESEAETEFGKGEFTSTTWVRGHHVWIIGIGCTLAGFALGWLTDHLHHL